MSFTRDQLLDVINRLNKEMSTPEFFKRFTEQIKERGPQSAPALFDELENLHKFLYVEWDLYPEVNPEDMLTQIHNAAKEYPTDKEVLEGLTCLCHLVEGILLRITGNQNVAHGHSHGPGQPICTHNHGHGQQQGAAGAGAGAGGAHGHTHSHGGQPCTHNHGHSHGGGHGHQAPSPQQMELMKMAVETALDESEREYMKESQEMLMQGRMGEITEERKSKMMEIQSKIVAYVQTMSQFLNENSEESAPTDKNVEAGTLRDDASVDEKVASKKDE